MRYPLIFTATTQSRSVSLRLSTPAVKKLIVSACVLLPIIATAQTQPPAKGDYYTPDHFRYSDYTYAPNIRTAQLYPAGSDLLPPILDISKPQQLTYILMILMQA